MIIAHRINTTQELRGVNKSYGIEVDVRFDSKIDELVLTHDISFENNCSLIEFLKEFNHALLILNIKSSLCEELSIEIMNRFGIENYLFLDSQIPDIVKFSKIGYGDKFISRISQYESENENLLDLCSKYVWVDTFGELDLSFFNKRNEKEYIFVSPELHKKAYNIAKFRELIESKFHEYHICTDFEQHWK
jgi:hypothetical protein